MKKIGLVCLAIGMSLALCACGQVNEEPAEETQEQGAQEAESGASESLPEQDDPVPTSYLTGLECSEEEREQRPIAIMINNLEAGCPQAGIGQASVI